MLSLLLLLSAATAQSQDNAELPAKSRIVVQGYASVKSPPDVATISFDVRGEGKTSDQAVAALAATGAAVQRSLLSMDPATVLRSNSVKVQAVRGNDCKEEDYDETVHLSAGKCAIDGYVAEQDFTMLTSRVKDAGTIVSLAGRRGAYNPRIASFGLANSASAKQVAIAAALADARNKAQAIAAASGVTLGPVVSVALDGAQAGDEIVVTELSRNSMAERDEPIVVNIEPVPEETSARVSVAFAMSR